MSVLANRVGDDENIIVSPLAWLLPQTRCHAQGVPNADFLSPLAALQSGLGACATERPTPALVSRRGWGAAAGKPRPPRGSPASTATRPRSWNPGLDSEPGCARLHVRRAPSAPRWQGTRGPPGSGAAGTGCRDRAPAALGGDPGLRSRPSRGDAEASEEPAPPRPGSASAGRPPPPPGAASQPPGAFWGSLRQPLVCAPKHQVPGARDSAFPPNPPPNPAPRRQSPLC